MQSSYKVAFFTLVTLLLIVLTALIIFSHMSVPLYNTQELIDEEIAARLYDRISIVLTVFQTALAVLSILGAIVGYIGYSNIKQDAMNAALKRVDRYLDEDIDRIVTAKMEAHLSGTEFMVNEMVPLQDVEEREEREIPE